MSSDNYYLIRRHPKGGFAAVHAFMSSSDDGWTPQATDQHPQFDTIDAAILSAADDYTEYGTQVHTECRTEAVLRPCEPERANREGDSQGLPTVNNQPFVQDAVIADIEARKAIGVKRYGTALQPFNGRDALLDAYEEALDLSIYLKQALIERDAGQ